MANNYSSLDPYGNYGDKNDPTPYELLMQMKAWNKEIYLTIENMDEEMRTQLSVLDGEIRQNILDVKQGLETTISTTASGIRAEISNTAQGLQTQITANANGVASKVSKTDYNGNTVASLITQTPTAVTAIAQSLNLSGYVTFSSLTASGTTNIDGARITTGYISADRIQASTVLAKLISAGGIDASYITSGMISANRLSANAIKTTLLQAGGISADLITAGTISGDRIYGGTIQGATFSGGTISISTNATIGGYLTLNSPYSGIYFGNYSVIRDDTGTLRVTGGSSVSITAPLGVHVEGYAKSTTHDLGFGYSSTSKRLYVKIGNSDVGYVTLA